MNVTIIIPSLNPDEKLSIVVNSLINEGFDDIIVVDDGSDQEHKETFEKIGKLNECRILTHDVNKGKGRALKTAFSFILENRPNTKGVITVDGDNQHKAYDIKACGEKMLELKDKVILGARCFKGNDVPFKSKYGNNLTSLIFKFTCGINISDTQTGLRAIPFEFLEYFNTIKGERFEYETNMLLEMHQHGIEFVEVPIETVYINDNATSHFNPLVDSFKIYSLIIKFFLSSISASVIDLAFFTLFTYLLSNGFSDATKILIATVGARIISSLANFLINKKVVFKAKEMVKGTIVRYYILCVLQMLASYGLVFAVSLIFKSDGLWDTLIKAIIDTLLFLVSFQIQREWVFKKK